MTAGHVAAALAAGAAWLAASAPVRGLGEPTPDFWGSLVTIFRRRLTRQRPTDMAEFLSAFAGELAAGQPLADALAGAATGMEPVPCPLALRAASCGGDVPAALRLDAGSRFPELRSLAACWEVASTSGTGLAGSVTRLAATARAAANARGELTAELAATRASGRILMFLPVFGILTGVWIGADPINWLLTTLWGRLALGAGIALQVVAFQWLRRITKRAAEGL